VNSLETKIKVPPNPIITPKILPHLKKEPKKKIPINKVNSGVIPFNTAATDESMTVSANAKRKLGKKVPKYPVKAIHFQEAMGMDFNSFQPNNRRIAVVISILIDPS